MDDGHIVEQGSHDDLLARHGFYYDLYNSQFTDALAAASYDTSAALGMPLVVIRPDDSNWAVGVMNAVSADRAKQCVREASVSAAAHDQQLSAG